MKFDVNIRIEGDWESAISALDFYGNKTSRSLKKALLKESKYLAKEIKKNLKKGGSPPFAPIAPFTRAVRKALGVQGRKPGIATKQLLKSIKHHKIDRHTYFSGVKKGTKKHVRTHGAPQEMTDIAATLEHGRPSFVLELDRKGPSGKTPRQWLWWLYLSGAIKSPPNSSKTHMQIGAAPSRPFVSQVVSREANNIVDRVMRDIHKDLMGYSGKGGIPWLSQ